MDQSIHPSNHESVHPSKEPERKISIGRKIASPVIGPTQSFALLFHYFSSVAHKNYEYSTISAKLNQILNDILR